MLRLVSDEDVRGSIIRGLLLRAPALDLVRVQDVGLAQTPDQRILEWAAAEGRILVSNDRKTLIGHAVARVKAGDRMPGVLVLRPRATIGLAIDDILRAAQCYTEVEIKDQVVYIPFLSG